MQILIFRDTLTYQMIDFLINRPAVIGTDIMKFLQQSVFYPQS